MKLRRADLSVVIADELGPGDTFGEACMLDERRLLGRSSSHPHALNGNVNKESRGDGSGSFQLCTKNGIELTLLLKLTDSWAHLKVS